MKVTKTRPLRVIGHVGEGLRRRRSDSLSCRSSFPAIRLLSPAHRLALPTVESAFPKRRPLRGGTQPRWESMTAGGTLGLF